MDYTTTESDVSSSFVKENAYQMRYPNIKSVEIAEIKPTKETIDEIGKLVVDKPSQYLDSYAYSLHPDIKNGWLPKIDAPGAPIPLRYDLTDEDYDEIATPENIIYYGYRPKTTFELHKRYSNKNSYPFIISDKILSLINEVNACSHSAFNTTRLFGMIKEDALKFDSMFESGNLDMVVKVAYDEYDLYMRTDSNTRGHKQWFNFTVSSKDRIRVKLNIVNFTKKNSLYEAVTYVIRE